MKVYLNENQRAAEKRLKNELENIKESYDQLLAIHSAEHGELFQRLTLEINPELNNKSLDSESLIPNESLLLNAYKGEVSPVLIQRMFEFGRYLLISSTR